MGRFDCIYTVIVEDMNYDHIYMLHILESGENIIGSIYNNTRICIASYLKNYHKVLYID
jgi:hypothetical protein